MPNEPVERVTWGHSIGSPQAIALCDRAATTWANVPHAHRTCTTDADCRLFVANGNCFTDALNLKASVRAEYRETPCGRPDSGACDAPRSGFRARCYAGCCRAAY